VLRYASSAALVEIQHKRVARAFRHQAQEGSVSILAIMEELDIFAKVPL